MPRPEMYYALPPSAAGKHAYYILLEDVPGDGTFWAELSDKNGASLGGRHEVEAWGGLLTGATAGYHAQYAFIDGTFDFQQGPCIVPCDTSGTLTVGSPPDAQESVAYGGHSVGSSGINAGSISATGLPSSLVMDSSGNVTGTPDTGTAGTYYVTVTASAPGTVSGNCTLTRIMPITVIE